MLDGLYTRYCQRLVIARAVVVIANNGVIRLQENASNLVDGVWLCGMARDNRAGRRSSIQTVGTRVNGCSRGPGSRRRHVLDRDPFYCGCGANIKTVVAYPEMLDLFRR